jgi:hypothetical protein
MADEDAVWLEFVESKVFYRRVRELSIELLTTIQTDLVENPERGNLIQGTGGARKARIAAPIRGAARAGVIVTCIYIFRTLSAFTCFIYMVKMSKRIYLLNKREC